MSFGGISLRNFGPAVVSRCASISMRTERSPSWATGPYYRFLPVFQNKKRIFEVLSFNDFRKGFLPKLRADCRGWMCVHIDANRTLSQLSYRPILPLFARFSEQKADFWSFKFSWVSEEFLSKIVGRHSQMDVRPYGCECNALPWCSVFAHGITHGHVTGT